MSIINNNTDFNSINNKQNHHIEYEDAYIIEEKNIKLPDDEEEDEEVVKDISLNDDSLVLSDDDKEDLDYNKLKTIAETKRKNQDDINILNKKNNKNKITGAHSDFNSKVVKREEVVEDFIRNFFMKYNLTEALLNFNNEYNELVKKGKFYDNILGPISDVRIKNLKLKEKYDKLVYERDEADNIAKQAKSKWEALRKERDFHKENYLKTIAEKQIISNDIKRLKNLHNDFQEKIKDLSKKYEHLYKQKSLKDLEIQKLENENKSLENESNNIRLQADKAGENKNKQQDEPRLSSNKENIKTKEDQKLKNFEQKLLNLKKKELTPFPSNVRPNLFLAQNYTVLNSATPNCIKEIKAHEKSVASLCIHPKKLLAATGGDDANFRIYNLNDYEELVSGIGHKDYISGIDIHPIDGSRLITCSGDFTIKVWDLYNLKNLETLYDHNSIVWDIKFHDTGNFFVSCSEDNSIKLYDMNNLDKPRNMYNGHTASVNKITFQPYTNYFASCSADKTISIWDIRTKQPIQTYYGHINCVNSLVFNAKGDKLFSCDADGITKMWDIRMTKDEKTFYTLKAKKSSAECIEIDKSNTYLYVGYSDGYLSTYSINKESKTENKIHERSVNQLGINISNSNIYSVGGDGILKVHQLQ